MVQWLGLGSFTAGAQVQSLVRELVSCKPHSMAKKKKKKIINKYPGFYDIVEKDKQPGRKISKTLFYKRHANGY